MTITLSSSAVSIVVSATSCAELESVSPSSCCSGMRLGFSGIKELGYMESRDIHHPPSGSDSEENRNI